MPALLNEQLHFLVRPCSNRRQPKAISSPFLFICVVQTVILARLHGLGHFVSHFYPKAILKWPHAVQMEKGNPIVLIEKMIKVGLHVWHSAQFSIYESDTAFFSWQMKMFQKIADGTTLSQFDFGVCVTSLVSLTAKTRKLTIEPDVNQDISHLASSNWWEHSYYISIFEPATSSLYNSIDKGDASFLRGNVQ
jgi:hypothetical protein